MKTEKNQNHHCGSRCFADGEAVCECYEENGKLFVVNGEYKSQVNYCPFCGYKAKVLISSQII